MMPERPTNFILHNCALDELEAIRKYFPGCEIDDRYSSDAIKLFNPTTKEHDLNAEIVEFELVENGVSYIQHGSEILRIICAEGEKRSDVLIFMILWISGCNLLEVDYADIISMTEGKKTLIYHSISADATSFADNTSNFLKALLPDIRNLLCGIITSDISLIDLGDMMNHYEDIVLSASLEAQWGWIVLDGPRTMETNRFIVFTWN
ncbi:MAG: hypothetical protein K6G65_09720 [Lachnospiraceae bacterium]|nr:hypothetical protein [Lachnospiraceae bacterium]